MWVSSYWNLSIETYFIETYLTETFWTSWIWIFVPFLQVREVSTIICLNKLTAFFLSLSSPSVTLIMQIFVHLIVSYKFLRYFYSFLLLFFFLFLWVHEFHCPVSLFFTVQWDPWTQSPVVTRARQSTGASLWWQPCKPGCHLCTQVSFWETLVTWDRPEDNIKIVLLASLGQGESQSAPSCMLN